LPLAAVAGVFGVGQALAADDTVEATNSQADYTALTDTPSIPGGGSLDFHNSGSLGHSVTANGNGPDGSALFTSGVISNSTHAERGVQYLPAGNYNFHCVVHPSTMKGTLTVSDNGADPRPDIDVKIKSSSLNKVRNTHKLKVEVDAHTKSDNVALVAKKGHKAIARKSNLDLGAGDSRNLSMRLTRAGRKALKGLDSARVKLTGTVPFGAPDTARRKLN
jgi:plastocyanin